MAATAKLCEARRPALHLRLRLVWARGSDRGGAVQANRHEQREDLTKQFANGPSAAVRVSAHDHVDPKKCAIHQPAAEAPREYLRRLAILKQ
jgi:hypothetical protein